MQLQKLVLKKVASFNTKVGQCSTKVAPHSTKVGIKKISSKHTHAASSFKDLAARNPMVKTGLNFDARLERYDFLEI